MKRSRVAAAMIATLAISMIGCSNNTNSSPTGQDSANKQITMRMSWWGGDTRHKTTLDAIKLYESKHPNIKIEGEYGGFDGYLEKLTTQLAARTAPDIIQIDYAYLDQFTKQSNLFVDLKNNKNIDLGGFDADFIKSLTTSSGKLIGVPTGINASTFFLNKTLADQVGVDYKTQLTWDRLLEEGKKLHQAHSNMYLLNQPIVRGVQFFIFEPYLVNLTGKSLFNDDFTMGFDRDSLVRTFSYVQSLYDNGVIQPLKDTVEIQNTFQNPKWLNNELVGALGFSADYSPMVSSLPKNEVITVDFPATKGVKNTGIILRPTNMLAVSADSKSPDEAAKFIQWFLNDPEAIKISGVERSIPAVTAARKQLMDAGVVDKPFDNSVNYAVANQGMPQSFFSVNGELQKIEQDTLTKLIFKELTPDQAADQFMKLMTSKLAELKKKG